MLQVMEALCAMALQAGGPGDDATASVRRRSTSIRFMLG